VPSETPQTEALAMKDVLKIWKLATYAPNDYEIVSLNGRIANTRPTPKEE